MTSKLDAIKSFVMTVETGSLSGASRKSGLSIATISRQITSLEERLGLKLLIRSTRKIVLTEEGNTYYSSVKNILNDLEHLEINLKDKSEEPSGNLHISAPTLFGRNYLIPILAEFTTLYPQINLEITLLDRPVDLLDEGIDIAIRIGELEDSSLLRRELGKIRWVLCASPEYLKNNENPQNPNELIHHDCLVYSQTKANNEWSFKDHNSVIKIKVPVKMRSNTLDAVVAFALKGRGIVMTPAWFVSEHIKDGSLRILMPEYEMNPRPISALFTHNHLLAHKVRILLDYLIEQLRMKKFY